MIQEDDVPDATDDEVIVETPDSGVTETEVVVEKPVDDDPAAGIAALRLQIEKYEERAKTQQRDLEEERRHREQDRLARVEAERRARVSQTEARETDKQAREARWDAVVNALSAAQGQLVQQKSAYKQAMIDSDFDKAADIAAEIGVVAGRISQFEAGKAEMEALNRSRPAGPAEDTDDNPQETFINRLPPRSAAWVRQHRDRYFNDARFQNMVAGAHQLALGRGIQPESDSYFKFIEEETGVRERPAETVDLREETRAAAAPTTAPTSAAATAQPRRSPTPSAPAASGAPTSTRPTGTVSVELTQEEREFCRVNDIPEANYAKQKKSLRDEGLIGTRH